MNFFRKYWDVLTAYAILLIGFIVTASCVNTCEELGCLGCTIYALFFLGLSVLFSLIMLIVSFVRGKASFKLWWFVGSIVLALVFFFFARFFF